MFGLHVTLHAQTDSGDEMRIEGTTDEDGEIWFADVAAAASCRLMLAMIVPPGRAATKASDHSWMLAIVELTIVPPVSNNALIGLNATQKSSLPDVGSSEPLVFYLPDQRVIALLEEIAGGGAMLTLVTEAAELSGATVRFAWGDESGEVELEPAGTDSAWSGQCRLQSSFADLAKVAPSFELIPPQTEE